MANAAGTGANANANDGAGGSAGTGSTAAPAPTPTPGALVTASCANPVAPIDLSVAQPVTVALLPLAAQKGMSGAKPHGAPVAAQLQQGQCTSVTINMSPGKCYSVVGASAPTVQNLDLALVPVLLPGLPEVVAASDRSSSATAVIGEGTNCIKWALTTPGTMKLIMSVTAGQGLAAAQVLEK